MVSTNSLTPDLNFTVQNLLTSDFPEDQEIGKKAQAQLEKLLKEILPVIMYVDGALFNNVRGIIVVEGKEAQLMLSRNGQWYKKTQKQGTQEGSGMWMSFSFSDIIAGLTTAFQSATQKKEEYLASVKKRGELLEQISAVIGASQQK